MFLYTDDAGLMFRFPQLTTATMLLFFISGILVWLLEYRRTAKIRRWICCNTVVVGHPIAVKLTRNER